ncbi:sensor domain-containing diguanylate cyclase [Pararobbsia silviterrae]|uniref:diguanylate cyclase n=1 Tax=Pararobbsia silviterrae TaxID=1792498 RepID=A0A494XVX4_9BURK|nr:sensor domain-containing diguanylate cyclase [Pararobbsia silviterrae]RKP54761.1 sensor domain-containing diguanylate cyclase [Pararobbsia silviterrae]
MNEPTESVLADRLRLLVQTVQRNETTLKRFQRIELALISAQGIDAYFDTLFGRLPVDFALSWVGLWLDENTKLVSELFGQDALRDVANQCLKLGNRRDPGLVDALDRGEPWLGMPDHGNLGGTLLSMFTPANVESMIVLPLLHQDATLGFLCLASDDPDRFARGMATDLLERFATVAAASLDNVGHRERLKRIGLTDPLTDLANRRYFDERLRGEVMRSARHGAPLACIFFDIDHFKHINDLHGHSAGDRALIAVARAARRQMRLADTLSRYGGEEFAGLLLHADRTGALAAAERIRKAVQELDVLDDQGGRMVLTVSVGIAMLRAVDGANSMSSAVALVAAADRAMYLAKHNGRNRVEIVDIAP